MSKFEWEDGEVTYTPPPPEPPEKDELQEEIDRIDKILEEAGDVASATAFVADGVTDDKEPLYVYRKVLNAGEIIKWAKAQGLTGIVSADDLHVTVCYSRTPVDWMEMGQPWEETIEIPAGGPRMVKTFGEGAQVLLFASSSLKWRHEEFLREGASWDHSEYQPHITLTYTKRESEPPVQPYTGKIVLGPEIFEEIKVMSVGDEQPRAPAGTSTGGQWVKSGAGSGGGAAAKASKVGVTRMKGGPATEDELDAVHDYMEDASGLNNELRNNKLARDREDTVEELDSLIARSSLTEGMDLYRGLTPEAVEAIKPERGKTFSDSAFVSTSRSKRRAEEFSESTERGMGYVMRIYAKAGQKAADLAAITGDSFEQEVLLPRGQRFKIMNVDDKNRTLYVYAVD